eukprot:4702451-Amphidinium_carterae.1
MESCSADLKTEADVPVEPASPQMRQHALLLRAICALNEGDLPSIETDTLALWKCHGPSGQKSKKGWLDRATSRCGSCSHCTNVLVFKILLSCVTEARSSPPEAWR